MFDLQLGALKLFTQLNGPKIVKSWGHKDFFCVNQVSLRSIAETNISNQIRS